MANPTTNYGWPMPTSTDLVTDLPADFAAFGQPVDTSLKALNPGTTLGDIAYSSATANTNTRLPIGTSGQVLAVSGGGVPAWTTTADVTPLTTKGDLFTFTTVDARIGVGSNFAFLQADSAESTGLLWNNAAWTTYTPTYSATIGTITTVTTTTARYLRVGKLCHLNLDFTITNAGTGSGTLEITLPFNSVGNTGAGCGRETDVAGYMFYGALYSNKLQLRKFDGTGTVITTNHRLPAVYTYEVA